MIFTLQDRLEGALDRVRDLEEGHRCHPEDPELIRAKERLAEAEREAEGQQVGRAIVRLLAYLAVFHEVDAVRGSDPARQRQLAGQLAAWALEEQP